MRQFRYRLFHLNILLQPPLKTRSQENQMTREEAQAILDQHGIKWGKTANVRIDGRLLSAEEALENQEAALREMTNLPFIENTMEGTPEPPNPIPSSVPAKSQAVLKAGWLQERRKRLLGCYGPGYVLTQEELRLARRLYGRP